MVSSVGAGVPVVARDTLSWFHVDKKICMYLSYQAVDWKHGTFTVCSEHNIYLQRNGICLDDY